MSLASDHDLGPAQVPFCVHCRHYKRINGFLMTKVCMRNRRVDSIDPVSGAVNMTGDLYCDRERASKSKSACGPRGRHFSERKEEAPWESHPANNRRRPGLLARILGRLR